jgi:hypothetical protein
MAANVIELVARYRDEGALAGMQKTAAATNTLSTALGIGVGAGLAGAAVVAAGALVKLALAPVEAARGFSQMVERVDMGSEAFRKSHTAAGEAERGYRNLFGAVGVEGVQAFRELALAQREADDAWQRMMANISLGLAGPLANLATAIEQITSPFRFNPAIFAAIIEARRTTDTEHRQLSSTTGLSPAQQKALADDLEREARTADKARKALEDFEHRRRQAEAAHLGITVTAKRPDRSTLISGGGLGEEDFPRFEALFTEVASLGEAAALSVSNSLVTIASNFTNSMQTIGSAAKAFWRALVNDILAQLARLALARLGTFLLGLGLRGPLGAFVGAAGTAFGGTKAGAPRTEPLGRRADGNTYILQGLNTRDMYMELTSPGGSLRRANDQVLMRAEIG